FGDIAFSHQLHMPIVRSAYANAVLRSVNVAAALAVPGVVAVWTAADIDDLPPIDFRDPAAEALRPFRQPLLARQWLRYVGEPVAAVFATDAYLAEDAAELVSIDADELAPVLAADAAPGNFSPGQSTEALVLKEGNTGGGFGVRGELYPEDFLVCLAALRLGRPVKWIEDRREHLMAANHSRQQHHHARVAVDAEGRILALDDEFCLDQGAYIRTHGARVA